MLKDFYSAGNLGIFPIPAGNLGIFPIQKLFCSEASCYFFWDYISFKNCSALWHSVISRNLLLSTNCSAPRPALLCSILSLPEIYSIQDLLCSAASCIYQKSILSRICSALQHPVFSRNLFYLGSALLGSILSFPEIFSI